MFLNWNSGRKKVKLKWSSVKNAKKWAVTDLNAPDDSRDILLQSQQFEQGVCCSICLKFCGLLEVSSGISLDFKFRCYGN